MAQIGHNFTNSDPPHVSEVLHVISQQPVPAHSRLLLRMPVRPLWNQWGRIEGRGPEPQTALPHPGG